MIILLFYFRFVLGLRQRFLVIFKRAWISESCLGRQLIVRGPLWTPMKLFTGRALSFQQPSCFLRSVMCNFGRKPIWAMKNKCSKKRILGAKKLSHKTEKLPLFCYCDKRLPLKLFPVLPLIPKLTFWSFSNNKGCYSENCFHCKRYP